MTHGLRAAIAARLERASATNGTTRFPRAARDEWGAWLATQLQRPTRGAAGAALLVSVGGATVGGSGKTPVVRELARSLRQTTGLRVTVAAHGYRGRVRTAKWVEATDRAEEVGDDALFLARGLSPRSVAVGPSREAALALASAEASVVLIDGPLALTPRNAEVRLLVVDAIAPWGSGRLRPLGDLLAPPDALLRAATDVLWLGDSPLRQPSPWPAPWPALACAPSHLVHHQVAQQTEIQTSRGPLAPDDLAAARIGIFTAIARPERLVRALLRAGASPVVTVRFGDHGPVRASVLDTLSARHRLDAWITTEKCILHTQRDLLAPVWTASLALSMPQSLLDRISYTFSHSSRVILAGDEDTRSSGL